MPNSTPAGWILPAGKDFRELPPREPSPPRRGSGRFPESLFLQVGTLLPTEGAGAIG